MNTIETRDLSRNANARAVAFNLLNNAGKGFDPTDDIDGWRILHEADTTDDVSVYMDEDENYYLVGTDGSGSDDSRWAVRFGSVGLAE